MTDTALPMSLGESSASKGLDEKNGMHQVEERIKAGTVVDMNSRGLSAMGRSGHMQITEAKASISHGLSRLQFSIGVKTLGKKS